MLSLQRNEQHRIDRAEQVFQQIAEGDFISSSPGNTVFAEKNFVDDVSKEGDNLHARDRDAAASGPKPTGGRSEEVRADQCPQVDSGVSEGPNVEEVTADQCDVSEGCTAEVVMAEKDPNSPSAKGLMADQEVCAEDSEKPVNLAEESDDSYVIKETKVPTDSKPVADLHGDGKPGDEGMVGGRHEDDEEMAEASFADRFQKLVDDIEQDMLDARKDNNNDKEEMQAEKVGADKDDAERPVEDQQQPGDDNASLAQMFGVKNSKHPAGRLMKARSCKK